MVLMQTKSVLFYQSSGPPGAEELGLGRSADGVAFQQFAGHEQLLGQCGRYNRDYNHNGRYNNNHNGRYNRGHN